MTPEEIKELMALKGWNRTKLAAELDLTENAVYRWMIPMEDGGRNPGGPASILMRMWLEEARTQAKKEAVA